VDAPSKFVKRWRFFTELEWNQHPPALWGFKEITGMSPLREGVTRNPISCSPPRRERIRFRETISTHTSEITFNIDY
jgi:hypothetical protein